MFRWLYQRWASDRVAQVHRLTQLARQADELIAYGNLAPATRQQLQARCEELRQQALALALVGR